jgi:hypothetical protein
MFDFQEFNLGKLRNLFDPEWGGETGRADKKHPLWLKHAWPIHEWTFDHKLI